MGRSVRALLWSSMAACCVLACGCAEEEQLAPPVACVAPPPPRVGERRAAPRAEDPAPPMNLGFSRYVPPPLPWRRESISLGYIGDWPLRTEPAPESTYPTRPFTCFNCDPDYLFP